MNSAILRRTAVLTAAFVALSGSLMVPLSASATPTTTPSPNPTPTHMHSHNAADYTAAAKRLPGALVSALQRDLGKSGAEYLADAAAASDGVKVVAGLKASGVKVLGSSVDGTTLTVNVQTSTDAAAVTAAGGVAQLGAPTTPDLSGLTFQATQDIHGGQGIYWATTGGSGYRCSVGFNGYVISSGAAQLATAGHCVAAMSSITSSGVQFANQTAPGNSFTVGPVIGTPGPGSFGNGYDAGLVTETGSGNAPQADALTWGGGSGAPLSSSPLTVTGESAAIVGADLCKSGSTSGWSCGTVEAVDTTLNVQDDNGVVHTVNSILATTCVQSGDSGGAALVGQIAVGLVSSSVSSPACGQPDYFSAYFPLISAAGKASVTSQFGSQWEPMISVSTPVVQTSNGGTTKAGGSITGTLANPDTTSKVTVYLDGSTTAAATASASAGNWTIALPTLAGGSHTYSIVASWATWSRSTAATGNFSTSSAPAPTLVVSGNKLVDTRTNTTFTPHGVNWPSFEYACEQGWGYSGSNSTAEAQAIASWNVNIVRLPLNENCWLGTGGSPAYGTASGYRAAVLAWVTKLHAAGLAVILDLHWSAPPGYTADGQRAMADSQSVTFWNSVATTYASDPAVVFDLFNEPYSRGSFQLTWSCWANGGCQAPVENDTTSPLSGNTYTVVGMSQLVSTVRTAGAAQPIMLGGLDYSNDLTGWLANRPSDTQLIASWHNYQGQDCDNTSCWNSEVAPVAATVPVIASEFGEDDGSSSFLSTFMTWADANGVGYAPWAWWDVSPSESQSSSYYALYSGSSFTPKSPSGTTYYNHLTGHNLTPGLPSGSPFGVIDTATTGIGTFTVTGWAIDPDTTSAVSLRITVDGTTAATPTANTTKSGLGTSFPGYGDNHGYSATTTASGGTHQVCIVAVNQGPTAPDTQIGCRSITIPTGSPYGVIDTATTGIGSLTVTGWVIDPDTASAVTLRVTVDGTTAATPTANATKSGLGTVFPGYGDNHGYTATITAGGGTHQVCVVAVNQGASAPNGQIGCRSLSIPTGSPYGVIDTATTGIGTVSVTGWVIDPDTASAVTLRVTVDGTTAATPTANTGKSGLGTVFPGYGDNHGYSSTISASGGTHQVCVVAVNQGPSAPDGQIGCRSLSIPTGSPFGVIDTATTGIGTISLTGWTIDPDTADPISVNLTLDGQSAQTVVANTLKLGLGTTFPGYGDNHGYSLQLSSVPAGQHQLCVTAANVGPAASNSQLGCRTLSIPTGSPYGVIDTATAGIGSIAVTGWVIDPDTASAVNLTITVDGVTAASPTANATKSGLGTTFPGYGDNHGYTSTITASGGTHQVCITAVNQGPSAPNTQIGCRTVTVPTGSPYGVIDTATAGTGTVTVTGWTIDPDTASAISVTVTLDGQSAQTALANGVKSGLGATFPGYGDNHNYSVQLTGVTVGQHQVCVIALNAGPAASNSQLGCSTLSVH